MTLVDGEVYFQRRDAMKLGDSGKRVSQLQTPMNVDLEQLPYDTKLVALVNGTVHSMSGDTIQGGTVVIQDGKIVSVGKSVTVPSGAKVLDLKGLHVYPGFFDAGSVARTTPRDGVHLDAANTRTLGRGLEPIVRVMLGL